MEMLYFLLHYISLTDLEVTFFRLQILIPLPFSDTYLFLDLLIMSVSDIQLTL